MPEKDFDSEQGDLQSIHTTTWQDTTGSSNPSMPNDDGNTPLSQEVIPKLSQEQQDLLYQKWNDPAFQKELQDLLPKQKKTSKQTSKSSQDLALFVQQLIDAQENHTQSENNTTGIPDELKARLEAFSGISLDDVKVYYNSDLPDQHDALAYTEGTNVYIATGQEKHLMHELWHVIQYKQGRVKATSKVNKKPLDNREQMEHEAETIPTKVLQHPIDSTATIEEVSNPPTKVIQRIATQISIDSDGNIAGVAVRGRPKNTFGSSMGDHTTAFIVQTEGINVALQGESIDNAIGIIQELHNALSDLPGYDYMGLPDDSSVNSDSEESDSSSSKPQKASTEIGNRFMEENELLVEALDNAQVDNISQDLKLQFLQQAINAYLSARELIPFSTINVRAKNIGKAGKGHGESHYVAVLSTYERNSSYDPDTETIIEAIHGLFDIQSAGMLAVEQDEEMQQLLTGGITFSDDLSASDHLKLIWQQHLKSIEIMFPNAYKAVEDDLTDNEEDFAKNLARFLREDFYALYFRANTILRQCTNRCNGIKNQKINVTNLKVIQKIYENESMFFALVDNLFSIYNIAITKNQKADFKNSLEALEKLILRYQISTRRLISKKSPKQEKAAAELLKSYKANLVKNPEHQTSLTNVSAIKAFLGGRPMDNTKSTRLINRKTETKKIQEESTRRPVRNLKRSRPVDDTVDEETDEEVDDISIKKTFKKFKPNSDSSDSELDSESEDEVVVIPSTLTRTLDSMSIQLILADDGTIVRMLTSGRPPSPFSGTMGAHSTAWTVHLDRVRKQILGKDVPTAFLAIIALTKRIQKFATSRQDMTLGNNATYLYKGSTKAMINASNISSDNRNIATLQHLINATLAFYNLIPGVSRDRIDTSGKGEGTHRKTILLYEKYGHGTKDKLTVAIKGLFDGRPVGSLYKNHKNIIKEAYPDTYDLVFDNGEPKQKQKVIALSLEDDDEITEEDSQLSSDQIKLLKKHAKDKGDQWLVHVNNCLINAVTDAAGINRASSAEIIDIRANIGAQLGSMLWASERILNIILTRLDALRNTNLSARGVLVYYAHSAYTDKTTTQNNPLMIHHDGINHFTAM